MLEALLLVAAPDPTWLGPSPAVQGEQRVVTYQAKTRSRLVHKTMDKINRVSGEIRFQRQRQGRADITVKKSRTGGVEYRVYQFRPPHPATGHYIWARVLVGAGDSKKQVRRNVWRVSGVNAL